MNDKIIVEIDLVAIGWWISGFTAGVIGVTPLMGAVLGYFLMWKFYG